MGKGSVKRPGTWGNSNRIRIFYFNSRKPEGLKPQLLFGQQYTQLLGMLTRSQILRDGI